MGMFMKHNDILIGSMLDQLNLRFAPPQGKEMTHGGIEEMAALQKEFEIFKKGRPFAKSVAVLNLSAYNNDAKNHWHDLLGNLNRHKSNRGKLNGDAECFGILNCTPSDFAYRSEEFGWTGRTA